MPKLIIVKQLKPTYETMIACCLNTTGSPGGGCSPCRQCTYMIENRRCKRPTCLTDDYCWQHVQKIYGVRIKPSFDEAGNPRGLGLFAAPLSAAEKKQGLTVRFKDKQKICQYRGKKMSRKTIDAIYSLSDDSDKGQITQPYALNIHGTDHYIDALCVRSVAGYINHASGRQSNAEFTHDSQNRLWVEAKRSILPGQEILVNYGRMYDVHENRIRVETHEVKASYKGNNPAVGRYDIMPQQRKARVMASFN